MVRYVYCVTRREEVSLKEFRRFWQEEYAPLMARMAELMGAKEHRLSTTLAVEANVMLAETKGTGKAHDGLVEMFWDNAKDLMAKAQSPGAEEVRKEVLACEEKFVDLPRSAAFFTEA